MHSIDLSGTIVHDARSKMVLSTPYLTKTFLCLVVIYCSPAGGSVVCACAGERSFSLRLIMFAHI